MKKNTTFLLILTLNIFALNIFAQKQFWGMTSLGGASGKGCIFKTDSAASSLALSYSFPSYVQGKAPLYAKLVEAGGKFYGTASQGGTYNNGVLFEYDPVTDSTINLFNFNDTLGANPDGTLILGSNGKLYGMTINGGINTWGTIFEFDIVSGIYTRIYEFDYTNGANPYNGLVEISNGVFYGTTVAGGSTGLGVIFEFVSATGTITKKFDFGTGTNGAYQYGTLLKTSSGKLYGTTFLGGSLGGGVLFSFDPASGVFTKKFEFDMSTGVNPFGPLMEASSGKIYGMTSGSSQYGIIYEFDTLTSAFTIKYNFDYTNGAYPYGGLIEGASGLLYGYANDGGTSLGGVLFSFDPSGNIYVKLHDFDLQAEGYPDGTPIQGTDGALYGVTSNGGAGKGGIIFKYDISGSSFAKKADFDVSALGANPNGSLIRASDGKFYGMTFTGGSYNLGTVFEFDGLTAGYSVKHDFDGASGAKARGSLMQASNGMLYGMTSQGGANDFGVVFELDPVSGTYSVKHDFDSLAGSIPYGKLLEGADGNLYGMTSQGGANGFGIIFSLDPVSSTFVNRFDFDSITGANPLGSLNLATNGKMYGMGSTGGLTDNGVIFQFDPVSGSYISEYNFDGSLGAYPVSSLVEDTSGVLYGMTKLGGASNYGVIFSFDTLAKGYTVKHDFVYGNGDNPLGSLLLTSDGRLMGLTSNESTNTKGVMFQYDLLGSTFTKLTDFTGANGLTPQFTDLIEVCMPPSPAQAISGTSTICDAQTGVPYSVPVIAGASYYLWKFPAGATIISGDSTNSVSVNFNTGASSGDIIVKGVNECGVGDSSVLAIVVSICSGIKEQGSESDLSVNPNPSKGIFNLSDALQAPENAEIIIISTDGKIVYSTMTKEINNLSVDLSGKSPGIYFLQMKTSTRTIYKKLVIN